MNGRTFLKLTREGVDWSTWWDSAAVVGVEQVAEGVTVITFVDGGYVRVTEAADTVLAMMGARVVTEALTKAPVT